MPRAFFCGAEFDKSKLGYEKLLFLSLSCPSIMKVCQINRKDLLFGRLLRKVRQFSRKK